MKSFIIESWQDLNFLLMYSLFGKPLAIGLLASIFVVSLFYGYGSNYASGLLGFVGIQGSSKLDKVVDGVNLSPSDKVISKVTVKKVVTSRNVTSDKDVSPSLSPLTTNKQQDSYIAGTEPTVVTPTDVSPSVSLSPPPVGEVASSSIASILPVSVTTVNSVVINEIAWMGTGGTTKLSNDEWIELYNSGSNPINLDGWTLKSVTGNGDPQILLSGIVGPKGFYILERTDDFVIVDIVANRVYSGSLLDSGENLELKDASGLVVDSIRCEGSWYGGSKDGRFSMERINPNKIGDTSSNWGSNSGLVRNGSNNEGGLVNGTPGRANSIASF